VSLQPEAPLEPTPDLESEIAPTMETVPLLRDQVGLELSPPHTYWHAQGLADRVQREFQEAGRRGDTAGLRERFYLLAEYHARTIEILRQALAGRHEPLANAALRNLVTLHQALHVMHRAAPDTVPEALSVSRDIRLRLFEDMIVQVLQESARPLDVSTIARRVNDLDILADAPQATISRHLENLAASGYVRQRERGFVRTARTYHNVNLDQAGLHTLVGPALEGSFERAGFSGLSDVLARKSRLRALFRERLGLSDDTATLFLSAAEVLADSAASPEVGRWRHADLLGSPHPRPYQYEAFAIFRGYGYQGQLIEAPAGSGKTLIGMLCIQDWLRALAHGQTILVLVPTVNYQQQWVRELCHKPIGLRLPPHLVFTGTAAGLEAARRRVGSQPCVLVLTYAALAQLGSGRGKGGFDVDSIESFLQGNDVQYVVLDEVHKVVEDLHGVSADVTRALVAWLRDGSLRGLVGFSGTAAAFRPRFAQLGLQLVYVMPASELIANGFVAPFAELGVPFAFSEREQQIRDLVEHYRADLHEYVALLDSTNLRRLFSQVPLAERIALGRDLLRMYADRDDQDQALANRFSAWEQGGPLATTELPLITLLQLARGWSDQQLVEAIAPSSLAAFESLLARLERLRGQLRDLVYLPETRRRLSAEAFGRRFEAAALRALPTASGTASGRQEALRQGLAASLVGLLGGLTEWYQRVGEGRVGTIKAIVAAERAVRPIEAVIVFDVGRRIRWQEPPAAPGYGGVGGLFAELLGDDRVTPLAVLSSEIYLPYDRNDPLSRRVAAFIRRDIMRGELADVLFDLGTSGAELPPATLETLRAGFDATLADYVASLASVRARRQELSRQVLAPLRRAVRRARQARGEPGAGAARLATRQAHLRAWLDTFFDYAAIADRFDHARLATLQQVSGVQQRFVVVPMADGARKQLMYDLAARLVDDEQLPFNLIVVSTWARTGWNVVKPNLLIDATATRDVTAWQQLRGRAMRAQRSWTSACYQVTLLLLGTHRLGLDGQGELPADVVQTYQALTPHARRLGELDTSARALLLEAHHAAGAPDAEPLSLKIGRGTLADLSEADRRQLAAELMLARNKVTHIYELVKASGSGRQIRYDRAARRWARSETIAAKHAAQFAVSPLSGAYTAGPDHAPLLYAGDPRRDTPFELRLHLERMLAEADPRIVRGWLAAILAAAEPAP
jgi:superfamily II DNA or RNA helicase